MCQEVGECISVCQVLGECISMCNEICLCVPLCHADFVLLHASCAGGEDGGGGSDVMR